MKALSIACAVLAAFMGILVYVGTAHSQEAPSGPPCAPTEAVNDQLQRQYGETLTAAGVAGNGMFAYVTTNPETHSFTILVRRPDGMSCIVVGGEGWALADPAPPKKKGNPL